MCVLVCLRLTLDGDWFNGISCVFGFSVWDNFEVDTLDVRHSTCESCNGIGLYFTLREV